MACEESTAEVLTPTMNKSMRCWNLRAVSVCRAAAREIELQHSVLSAQLAAQSAAIQQEREALISQRINTDMLADLSEQVTTRTRCKL